MQIQIPDKDVGMCIGRGGCVIREMQQKTSTRIQIPSMPTPGQLYRIATITGPSEGCQKVAEIIARISAEQSSQFVITGEAFQSYGAGATYGQPQQQQSYYGQQSTTGQYGQQTAYGQQQQQYSAYTNTTAGAYGQQQAANTATTGKTDYSAEWAAYYAAQAASAGNSTAATATTQATAAAAPAAAATTAAAPTADASASQPAADTYHDAFFRYAYHYGDEAARKYYGAWSPAPGTPNPYGTNPNISAAPVTAVTSAAAPADTSATNANIKDSSVRNVSNLPAWMTKS